MITSSKESGKMQ